MKKMLVAATAVIAVPGLGPGVAHASAETERDQTELGGEG